jgi:hypothetical protein
MIENKQKQRDRYRSEVYAVNAILKKMEMSRFDELRQERGPDRSFLDNCTSDDDNTSVEDNADSNSAAESSANSCSNTTRRTESALTPTPPRNGSNSTSKGRSKGAKEPTGTRSKKPSSRKLHISEEEKHKSVGCVKANMKTSTTQGGAGEGAEGGQERQEGASLALLALEDKYQCPPHFLDSAPPSTSESEVCNFSFGV